MRIGYDFSSFLIFFCIAVFGFPKLGISGTREQLEERLKKDLHDVHPTYESVIEALQLQASEKFFPEGKYPDSKNGSLVAFKSLNPADGRIEIDQKGIRSYSVSADGAYVDEFNFDFQPAMPAPQAAGAAVAAGGILAEAQTAGAAAAVASSIPLSQSSKPLAGVRILLDANGYHAYISKVDKIPYSEFISKLQGELQKKLERNGATVETFRPVQKLEQASLDKFNENPAHIVVALQFNFDRHAKMLSFCEGHYCQGELNSPIRRARFIHALLTGKALRSARLASCVSGRCGKALNVPLLEGQHLSFGGNAHGVSSSFISASAPNSLDAKAAAPGSYAPGIATRNLVVVGGIYARAGVILFPDVSSLPSAFIPTPEGDKEILKNPQASSGGKQVTAAVGAAGSMPVVASAASQLGASLGAANSPAAGGGLASLDTKTGGGAAAVGVGGALSQGAASSDEAKNQAIMAWIEKYTTAIVESASEYVQGHPEEFR